MAYYLKLILYHIKLTSYYIFVESNANGRVLYHDTTCRSECCTIVGKLRVNWQSFYFCYNTYIPSVLFIRGARVAQWVRSLDPTTHTSLSPIRRGFAPSFVNYKKGALDSQPQVIKITSCLPRVGGSLQVLRLPPPLKLIAMI
jgi:hypothetical protein